MSKCDKCKHQDKHFKNKDTYYCAKNLLYPTKAYESVCVDFEQKTVTQADKIRQMSDKELAIKNVVYLHDSNEPYYIVSDGTIFGLMDCEIEKMSDEEIYKIALKYELEWLKSEVINEK